MAEEGEGDERDEEEIVDLGVKRNKKETKEEKKARFVSPFSPSRTHYSSFSLACNGFRCLGRVAGRRRSRRHGARPVTVSEISRASTRSRLSGKCATSICRWYVSRAVPATGWWCGMGRGGGALECTRTANRLTLCTADSQLGPLEAVAPCSFTEFFINFSNHCAIYGGRIRIARVQWHLRRDNVP